MRTDQLIEELTTALRAQIARAQWFAQLPADALLKRPAPEKWNTLEVFEHMNLSSGVYLKGLEKVFEESAASLPANPEFHPSMLGDYFTKAMQPKPDGRISWRMKTMRMFDPGRQHGASSESIARFISMCQHFLKLLQQARSTDLNRMKVASSLGPIIRFKAGDAFRFPIAHHWRHLLQAERLVG
ncbi:MAG: DinB family protein [Flavobacteriales bacterium]